MDFKNITQRLDSRLDVATRADLVPLTCKHVGYYEGSHHIASVKFYCAEGAAIPTRIQIQAAINKHFGQMAILEPTNICIGKHSLTVKVLSLAKLAEQKEPTGQYLPNLKAAMDEHPKAHLVEVGDIVRVFKGFVSEGEIAGGNADGSFNIRMGEKIEKIDSGAILAVAKAPKFFPIDDVAYQYFKQIYPTDFARLLSNNDPTKVENKSKK